MMLKHYQCILKNRKKFVTQHHGRKLKKPMVINHKKSQGGRIKLRKKINKKILKNKAPTKPGEVIKTQE